MKSGSGLPGRRTWKKLMVWVRPGVLLVLAILVATSALIKLDLPTLERPRKAISGAPGGGNCFGSTAAVTKRVSTFMQSVTVPFANRFRRRLLVRRGRLIRRWRQGRDPWRLIRYFRQGTLQSKCEHFIHGVD